MYEVAQAMFNPQEGCITYTPPQVAQAMFNPQEAQQIVVMLMSNGCLEVIT